MARVITFLSDYGLADEFVGVVHGVLAWLCPDARIIDLAHGVPRHDALAGALMLERALPFTPPGVHLAIQLQPYTLNPLSEKRVERKKKNYFVFERI